MANRQDLSAQLPDGQMFPFWEVEQIYERELHVDNKNPLASDKNSGSVSGPFKTINAAAQSATSGTRVLILGASIERRCTRYGR